MLISELSGLFSGVESKVALRASAVAELGELEDIYSISIH